jgi:hypothetical protein
MSFFAISSIFLLFKLGVQFCSTSFSIVSSISEIKVQFCCISCIIELAVHNHTHACSAISLCVQRGL